MLKMGSLKAKEKKSLTTIFCLLFVGKQQHASILLTLSKFTTKNILPLFPKRESFKNNKALYYHTFFFVALCFCKLLKRERFCLLFFMGSELLWVCLPDHVNLFTFCTKFKKVVSSCCFCNLNSTKRKFTLSWHMYCGDDFAQHNFVFGLKWIQNSGLLIYVWPFSLLGNRLSCFYQNESNLSFWKGHPQSAKKVFFCWC